MWSYTRRFATTILSATQRCNIVATLFRIVTTLFQHCNAVLRKKSSLPIVPCNIFEVKRVSKLKQTNDIKRDGKHVMVLSCSTVGLSTLFVWLKNFALLSQPLRSHKGSHLDNWAIDYNNWANITYFIDAWNVFFFSHIDKVSSFYSIIIVLSLVRINVRICEKYNFNQQVTRFSRSEPPPNNVLHIMTASFGCLWQVRLAWELMILVLFM